MAKDLGTQNGQYDLISTHTKYCPSQAEHLRPLDDLVDAVWLPTLCRVQWSYAALQTARIRLTRS